jgi:hypothetical protein
LRRSQNNQRLARKAASVERSEHEREFDSGMAELRDERAKAMTSATAAFDKTMKAATEQRKKAVQDADAAYIEKRDTLIKKLSRAAEAAA